LEETDVGLPLLLGLIMYGLIMAALTVWLVKLHKNRVKDFNNEDTQFHNLSHGNEDGFTQSKQRSGHQSSNYEK
jgi:hypothetical protein